MSDKQTNEAFQLGKRAGENLLKDMDEFLCQSLMTERGFTELEARQLIKHNELLCKLTDLQTKLDKMAEALGFLHHETDECLAGKFNKYCGACISRKFFHK